MHRACSNTAVVLLAVAAGALAADTPNPIQITRWPAGGPPVPPRTLTLPKPVAGEPAPAPTPSRRLLSDPSSDLIPPTGGGHAGFTAAAPAPATAAAAVGLARTNAALKARAAGDAGPLFDLGEWRNKLDTPSDADRGLYYREATPADPAPAPAPARVPAPTAATPTAATPTAATPAALTAPAPAPARVPAPTAATPVALTAGRLPATLGVTVAQQPPPTASVTAFDPSPGQPPRTRPRAALCAGGGLALLVADDVSVVDASGALLAGPTPLAAFLGRPDKRDYVGAARCVRDGRADGDGRWFVVGLRGRAPNDGRPADGAPAAQIVVAASVTEDPLGEWAGPFVVDADGVDRVGAPAPLPAAPPCASTGGCAARGLTVGQDAATLWATVDLYGGPASADGAGALAFGLAKAGMVRGGTVRPATLVLSGFTEQITPSNIAYGAPARMDGVLLASLPAGGLRVWAVTGTADADPVVSAPALLPAALADDPAAALPGGVPLPPSVGGGRDRAAPKRRLAALTLGPHGRFWGVVPAVARVGTSAAAATSVAAAWFALQADVAAGGATVDLATAAAGVVGVPRGASLLSPAIAPLADGRGAVLTAVNVAADAGPWLVAAPVGGGASTAAAFVASPLGAADDPPRPADGPVSAQSDPLPPPPADSVTSTAAAADGDGVWLVGQAPACGGTDARACDARGRVRVARVVV